MDAEEGLAQRHDTPLSQSGKEELQAVREWFDEQKVDRVYHSDYVRVRQTTEVLFGHRGIESKMLDFIHEYKKPSRLVGLPSEESQKYWESNVAKKYEADWQPEDGESFSQTVARAERLSQMLRELKGVENVAVVTHGVFIRHVLGRMLMGDKYGPEVFFDLLRSINFTPNGGAVEIDEWPGDNPVVRFRHLRYRK